MLYGGTVLSQDFKEFIISLNDNRVRYLVVGGYAVTLHGYPRLTKDIDVWYDRSLENVIKLGEALNDFGMGSLGLDQSDFMVEDQIIQLGYPPNRIDLISSLPGVQFSHCYLNRQIIVIDEIEVHVISLPDLKANKKATGRAQDLADLEHLE